jgi:hypothetical protein
VGSRGVYAAAGMPMDACAGSATAHGRARGGRRAHADGWNCAPSIDLGGRTRASVLTGIAIDKCHRAPRAGGVQDGAAAERSEGILDAAEPGARLVVDGGTRPQDR